MRKQIRVVVAGAAFLMIMLVGCAPESGDAPISVEEPPTQIEDDPIEMARVTLGSRHTYDEVRDATDTALVAGGEATSDDSRSRIWSSILKTGNGLTTKGYPNPDPMSVMLCLPGSMSDRGVALIEAVAYCSLEVAGIPESQW